MNDFVNSAEPQAGRGRAAERFAVSPMVATRGSNAELRAEWARRI
jgi:hypothetical protein